jgi:hypothetical protein
MNCAGMFPIETAFLFATFCFGFATTWRILRRPGDFPVF